MINFKKKIILLFLLVLTMQMGIKADIGIKVKPVNSPAPVQSIHAVSLNGTRNYSYYLGCTNGRIYKTNLNGRVLWEYKLKGIPGHITSGDIDKDGVKELVICPLDAQGNLVVLNADGTLRFTYPNGGYAFAAATVADLENDGENEIIAGSFEGKIAVIDKNGTLLWEGANLKRPIRSISVGNLGGGPKKEILVGVVTRPQHLYDHRGRFIWRYGPFFTSDAIIGDYNNDGQNEVIASGRSNDAPLHIYDYNRNDILKSKVDDILDRPQMVIGKFLRGVSTKQVFLNARGTHLRSGYRFYDLKEKKSLIRAKDFDGGFLNLSKSPDDKKVLLGSYGFQDNHFYEITFDNSGVNELDEFARRPPGISTVQTYKNLNTALDNYNRNGTTNTRSQRPCYLYATTTNRTIQGIRDKYNEIKPFESDNLKGLVEFNAGHTTVIGSSAPYNFARAINIARACEANRIPFTMEVAHGGISKYNKSVLQRICDAAPNYLHAFIVKEQIFKFPYSSAWPAYQRFCVDLMDICKRNDKKFMWGDHGEAWGATYPNDNWFFNNIIKNNGNTFIPVLRTNNPKNPSTTIGGMVGLKRAGYINDWGVSAQTWNYNWNQVAFISSMCPGDVLSRLNILSATLGASYFHIESKGFTRPELFKLFRKRLLEPVKSNQIKSLSSVGIYADVPAERDRAIYDAQGSRFNQFGDIYRHGFLGTRYSQQTLDPQQYSAYLYNPTLARATYGDAHFPNNPYGYLTFMPVRARNRDIQGITKKIITDDVSVTVNGTKYSPEAAKSVVLDLFRNNSANFLAKPDGKCYFSIHERVEGEEYILYLMDSHYTNPRGDRGQVKLSNDVGNNVVVTDLLKNRNVPVSGKNFSYNIEKGGIKIYKIKGRITTRTRRPLKETVLEIDGFNLEADNSIRLYPNPAFSIVNIQSENKVIKIDLFDISGKLLKSKNTSSSLSVADLSNGVYLMKIETEKRIYTKKLIVE